MTTTTEQVTVNLHPKEVELLDRIGQTFMRKRSRDWVLRVALRIAAEQVGVPPSEIPGYGETSA